MGVTTERPEVREHWRDFLGLALTGLGLLGLVLSFLGIIG